jgi:hypothetical protein
MIYRLNVEAGCFQFTQEFGTRVTPQLVELITSMLNGLLYDATATDTGYESLLRDRESRLLNYLQRDVSAALATVARSKQQYLRLNNPPPEIDTLDFLRWLVVDTRRRELSELIEGIPWAFDCK